MKHHHLLPSFLVCPQAACYDKNNRMLREEVQMSAKEVWSKYRLALPVFLCLAVAGFIIAMLLRAGRSAEPPMYAVDSSDSRSRPSSQTATRSSTGSRPPTVASETTGEKPKDETAKPVTRSSRTAKTTTLRTSRTTTAKSTKSTSAKTTRAPQPIDRSSIRKSWRSCKRNTRKNRSACRTNS